MRAFDVSLGVLAVAAIVALAPMGLRAAGDDETGFRKEVDGFVVYLAIMPAVVLKGPAEEPGASPFTRAPAARDTHHVMVSIFESAGNERIEGARVEARVAALGFSGEKKILAATQVAEAPVYAGRFPMLGHGPFRVDVEFLVPGTTATRRARFYFTHPSFAPPPGVQ